MFKFRLQRVLELREKAEQAKARELTAAQEAEDAARQAHDELTRLHQDSRAEVDAAQRSAPRVGHLQQLGVVLQALDQRLESSSESVRSAKDVVDTAQHSLELAARDRRVMDRLKDRHAEQWRAEESHKDRLNMDEIALGRFTRTTESRAADDASIRSSRPDASQDSSRNDGMAQ